MSEKSEIEKRRQAAVLKKLERETPIIGKPCVKSRWRWLISCEEMMSLPAICRFCCGECGMPVWRGATAAIEEIGGDCGFKGHQAEQGCAEATGNEG